jgi:hypothetical protein
MPRHRIYLESGPATAIQFPCRGSFFMSGRQFFIPTPYWPALLSVSLICWTLFVSPHTRYGDSWALVPIPVIFIAVIAIHVGLIIKRGPTAEMLTYALLHIAFLIAVTFWSLTLISKDSL